MIIDIDQIPEEGLVISQDFEFSSFELVEENTVFLDPVRAEATIRLVGEEVHVRGRITARFSLICCRCLSPFEFRVDSKFDHIYLPEELDIDKDRLEQDDLTRLFFYSRKLDLKEVILEQLNLTFPSRPLCAVDCQGICPICGQIIREGNCSCVSGETDPRLAKLKTLMRDKS